MRQNGQVHGKGAAVSAASGIESVSFPIPSLIERFCTSSPNSSDGAFSSVSLFAWIPPSDSIGFVSGSRIWSYWYSYSSAQYSQKRFYGRSGDVYLGL
jgi:hypothetical protein